jgi:DNA polymerase (family 10)
MTLPLATAEKIARKIVAELTPFCDQIEIAGSIRRRRPNVNDIDLVVLPKPPYALALRERCKRNAIQVQTDGEMNLIVTLPYPPAGAEGLQLDIFIATHPVGDFFQQTSTNFGTLLVCRTGSRQHNVKLASRAHQLGLHWNPYQGLYDGHGVCVARATEEDIFRALRLDFVPPEGREVA